MIQINLVNELIIRYVKFKSMQCILLNNSLFNFKKKINKHKKHIGYVFKNIYSDDIIFEFLFEPKNYILSRPIFYNIQKYIKPKYINILHILLIIIMHNIL